MEAAATAHTKVTVFLDGSGHDGQIRAATVLYRDRAEKKAVRKHMGSEECHTVFEAETHMNSHNQSQQPGSNTHYHAWQKHNT